MVSLGMNLAKHYLAYLSSLQHDRFVLTLLSVALPELLGQPCFALNFPKIMSDLINLIVSRLCSVTNMINKSWLLLSRDVFKSMCKKHIIPSQLNFCKCVTLQSLYVPYMLRL